MDNNHNNNNKLSSRVGRGRCSSLAQRNQNKNKTYLWRRETELKKKHRIVERSRYIDLYSLEWRERERKKINVKQKQERGRERTATPATNVCTSKSCATWIRKKNQKKRSLKMRNFHWKIRCTWRSVSSATFSCRRRHRWRAHTI